jgi:hypothetical protein
MNRKDFILGDADIRPTLRARLLARHADDGDTALIEELGVCRGRVRIDLAVVNGLLHGYEIKSDRDSLRRLDGQVDLYSKVLDQATLVVGDRHLGEALDIIPAWWGVVSVRSTSRGPRFKTVRRERMNPGMDPRALVELLWLDEAMALLADRGAARGVRGKPRELVWDRLCKHFDADEIAAAVRAHLKARVVSQVPPPPR